MAVARVVFMPLPAIGHLISAVELAKLLLNDHGTRFSVTILLMQQLNPAWASVITAYIESVVSLGLDITFQELAHVVAPLPRTKGESFVTDLVDAHKPLVRDTISQYLSTSAAPLAAILLDLFCTGMIDVAGEFNIPSYVYFPSTAAMLSLMLYLPYHYLEDGEGDIDLPGFSSLPVSVVPSIMQDKNDDECKLFLHHGERFRKARGIIVNTFRELEPASLNALVDGRCLPNHTTPPIFPVGPLLALKPMRDDGLERHECLKWLDAQLVASVVFLCFGSFGSFERPQVDIATSKFCQLGTISFYTLS